MDKIRAVVFAVLLALFPSACFTLGVSETKHPDGSVTKDKLLTAANLGMLPVKDDTGSSGSTSPITAMLPVPGGGVSTTRTSAFQEAQKPGEIRVGNVSIVGVVDHSTPLARTLDGVTSAIRNIISGQVFKKMLDTISDVVGIQEDTARVKSNNEAAIRQAEVNAEVAP